MVSNQAYLFLVFIVNGVLIGLLFDFFRIARKVVNTNDFITYIEDVLFWILAGAIVLYSIFIFNNGELRLFMFLGIILGAFSYMIFISSYVIKINVKIINILIIPFKVIFRILHKIFFKPFTFIFINIRKSFTKFGIKLRKQKNIVKNWKQKKENRNKCRIYKCDT